MPYILTSVQGIAKRPLRNMMRRHATWNSPRSATLVFRFLTLKLAISVQASYAVAYAALLRSLRATEDMPRSLSGFPGSFFAVHCATAAKGFALSGRWQAQCKFYPTSIKDHSSLFRDIAAWHLPTMRLQFGAIIRLSRFCVKSIKVQHRT